MARSCITMPVAVAVCLLSTASVKAQDVPFAGLPVDTLRVEVGERPVQDVQSLGLIETRPGRPLSMEGRS